MSFTDDSAASEGTWDIAQADEEFTCGEFITDSDINWK